MQQTNVPLVWIVDDDEDDQLFIRAAFLNGQPAVNTLPISDGAGLLPILLKSAELPRLILLDINMPFKNGFETLKELRSISKFADIPVIMLTTSSDDADRQRCLELGANDFLTKPLRHQQLRDMAQSISEKWELSSMTLRRTK